MKKFLLATVFATVFAATSNAADQLPAKAPLYPAPPAVGMPWSGFYLGGMVGGGWGNFDNAVSGYGYSVPLDTSGSGFTAGLYGGYNFLWDRLLIGIETDFAWANIRGGGDFRGKLDIAHWSVPWAAEASNRIGWLGTTRGRVGYLVTPRTLVYGTGGVAYGHVETDGIGVLGASSVNANFAVPFSGSATRVGWAAGAGVEYAVTNAILARVEYLHYDLGTANWSLPQDKRINIATDANGNLVRAGVAYKF